MGTIRMIPAKRRIGSRVIQDETPKTRVAAYCRVSTDTDEQATSYEAQVEHYTEYIRKNPSWECAGIYADDGISGTSTKKREEFNRLIDDCMKGKVDMVITKSISRFARNTLDCLNYIRKLKDKNIAVYFEKEGINTLDAKGEVMLTIMASLAQQESESLSQNVRLGLQYRYQQGKVQVNHNRFLGYDKDEEGKAKRSNLKTTTGKRRQYSGKFALSNLVSCCHCGGFYQRTHWNIHGRKSIVWRCLSRLKQKYSEVECHSRTVKESELQSVAVKAINEVFAKQDSYMSQIKINIEKVLSSTNTDEVAEIDSRIASLQKDLLKQIKQRQDCDKLGQEITELHERKYQLQLDDAKKDGVRQKISDLKTFLDEQETQIVEYDEALVRRLIERITVHDEHFTVEFKSGLEIGVKG